MSKRERNILIGALAALVAIAVLAFLLGRGCGDENEPATTITTPRTVTTPAVTITVQTAPEPEPEPAPAAAPVITEQSVNELLAHPGDTLTFEAKVQGSATRVYFVVGGQNSGLSTEIELSQVSTAGEISTWSGVWTVPATPTEEIYKARSNAQASDGSIVEYWGGGLSASQLPINVVP